jgi:exopolyphosphatase/guanosine-5'-triphosphate,3'-diphosphate pyrophosphatase
MPNSSADERCAVIDVGTNSVKLLVADLAGRTVRPVLRLSRQTRLGRGAFRRKRLQPNAIARTAAAVADLAAHAAALQPVRIRVLATGVVREAKNGRRLVQAIERAAELSVEIASGDQEAGLVFQGVTSDRTFASWPLVIVDVGGGSTEWIVGEGGFLYFTASTLLGTARLLEVNPIGDPPTPADLALCRERVVDVLHWDVRPKLQPVLRSFCRRELRLAGVGGALKSLARLGASPASQGDGKPICLELKQVRERVAWLWGLSARERRELDGLDPEKADVILSGALIYEAVMTEFGFSELFASERGLRDGALLAGPDLAPARGPKSFVVQPRNFGWPGNEWVSAGASEFAACPTASKPA